jgi:aromatic ring-opening dioxygenase LigB subunit
MIELAYALPHPPILVEGIGGEDDFTTAALTRGAYRQAAVRIVAEAPELIVIATPHGRVYSDQFHVSVGAAGGDWRSFGRDPQRYRVRYDDAFAHALSAIARDEGMPVEAREEPTLDHGLMVPMHFLAAAGLLGTAPGDEPSESCSFARVSVSLLDEQTHWRLGACVSRAARELGRRTVFIASGDLSHRLREDGAYGFAPEGPLFDAAVCEAFRSGELARLRHLDPKMREGAAECGLNSFLMLGGVFDGAAIATQLCSYEGPWGVGYAIAAFRRL